MARIDLTGLLQAARRLHVCQHARVATIGTITHRSECDFAAILRIIVAIRQTLTTRILLAHTRLARLELRALLAARTARFRISRQERLAAVGNGVVAVLVVRIALHKKALAVHAGRRGMQKLALAWNAGIPTASVSTSGVVSARSASTAAHRGRRRATDTTRSSRTSRATMATRTDGSTVTAEPSAAASRARTSTRSTDRRRRTTLRSTGTASRSLRR